MIKFKNISHFYGSKKALDDLNLEINQGEIFGLIGHNGAGKSTTIKGLVSILNHTEGEILVNDKPLRQHREEIKRMIAYVPDSPDMFLRLQASSYWNFVADAYDISLEDRNARIEELCKIFDMNDVKDKFIGDFSHGMRQKTFLIGALIPNPDIWILDEPMTGLDPQSSFNLKELMKNHAKLGKTVVFSTHVLEVAEKLCDRIGILRKGKLIFVGTMEELKAGKPDKSLEEIYLNMVSQEDGKDEISNEDKQLKNMEKHHGSPIDEQSDIK